MSRSEVIFAHEWIVRAVIRRLHAVERADLVQQGMIGLIIAVDTYEERRGAAFTTHAWWMVRREVQAYYRHEVRLGGSLMVVDGERVRVPHRRIDVWTHDEDGDHVMQLAGEDPSPEDTFTMKQEARIARAALQTAARRLSEFASARDASAIGAMFRNWMSAQRPANAVARRTGLRDRHLIEMNRQLVALARIIAN